MAREAHLGSAGFFEGRVASFKVAGTLARLQYVALDFSHVLKYLIVIILPPQQARLRTKTSLNGKKSIFVRKVLSVESNFE